MKLHENIIPGMFYKCVFYTCESYGQFVFFLCGFQIVHIIFIVVN